MGGGGREWGKVLENVLNTIYFPQMAKNTLGESKKSEKNNQ